jgi:hypothetical protein
MINKIFIPKKTKILLLFVIAVFLMLSCTQPSLPTTSATQIIETPTSTPPETLTSERTLTSPQVYFEVRSLCPEVGLDISKIPDLMGTIVLGGDDISIKDQKYSPDEGQKSILLFWNIGVDEKMKYQLLEEQKYYYFATSPDKEKLAFTIGKTLSMPSDVIVLTNHLEEKKFILPDDWTLFTWQNNEKLLIRQLRLYGENNDLVALNSLGGELQVLPSNFPNIYTAEPLGIWGALTIFDPTTSLVLYP